MATALCATLAFPAIAIAGRSIVTLAGTCNSTFRGSKRAVKTCRACIKGGGRYKKNRRKKTWSCEQKSSGISLEALKRSKSMPVDKGPSKPKSMPKSANKYVEVAAGRFRIGSRKSEPGRGDFEKQAMVTITRPFLMKATEVTQAEWHFIMGASSTSYDKACGGKCPVGHISWRDALEYLNELSEKKGLKPCYNLDEDLATWPKGLACKGYRLPTEAEWEYAARGGTKTARYGEADEIGWHGDNSNSKVHPVGKKKPNAYGLYDMLGSQWEWTWDRYEFIPFEGPVTDPVSGGLAQKSKSKDRVIRGGSYNESPRHMRAARRNKYLANSGSKNHGFRPVRTVLKHKKKRKKK